jgi:hypothetical protein
MIKVRVTYTLFFTEWGTRNNTSYVQFVNDFEAFKKMVQGDLGPNLVSIEIVPDNE